MTAPRISAALPLGESVRRRTTVDQHNAPSQVDQGGGDVGAADLEHWHRRAVSPSGAGGPLNSLAP